MRILKNVNDLKIKVIGIMGLYTFAILSIIIVTSIIFNYIIFEKQTKDKIQLLSQNYANEFDNKITGIENSVNYLDKYITGSFEINNYSKSNMNDYGKKIDVVIKSIAETTPNAQGAYFTMNPDLTGSVNDFWFAENENGIYTKQQGYTTMDFKSETDEMNWYFNTIKSNKGLWGAVYKDKYINIWMVSYTKAVYKDGILLGVVGIDMKVESIKNTIEEFKIYDSGNAYLMDNQYNFLFGNKKNMENEALKDLEKDIKENNYGSIVYKSKGIKNIIGYSRLRNNWILVCNVAKEETYLELKEQLIFTILATVIVAIVINFLALLLIRGILNSITSLTEIIKNTSNFNFTKKLDGNIDIESNNQISSLAKEVLNMRKQLKETGIDKAAVLQVISLDKESQIPENIEFDSIYLPSKTVSGDFYIIYKIDEFKTIGIIFDVCGKGVTAALNIYAFNILYKRAISKFYEPIEIIQNLNSIVDEFLDDTYVAACCFSFDFEKNISKIASAGLNKFIYSNNKNSYKEIAVEGPFLGMFKDNNFEQITINFDSGDEFYFYTDGLEYLLSDNNFTKAFSNMDSREIVKFIEEKINFTKGKSSATDDDCTLISLRVK